MISSEGKWPLGGESDFTIPADAGDTVINEVSLHAGESFATGSRRDSRVGKGRYDLLPPEAVARLAARYEAGAEKYDDRNWEKGQPLSRIIDSMLRHAFQALAGADDEDHLAAVAWNAFAAMTIYDRIASGRLPRALNDLNGAE